MLADYLPFCTTVRMPASPPVVPRCRDPFNMPFLQLAAFGGARFLVTGDKDILSLAAKFTVEIVDPLTFLRRLGVEV